MTFGFSEDSFSSEDLPKKEEVKLNTGGWLLRWNIVKQEQLDHCLQQQQHLKTKGIFTKIGELLIRNQFATSAQVARAVSKSKASEGRKPFLLPRSFCRRNKLMPIGIEKEQALIAYVGTKELSVGVKRDVLSHIKDQGEYAASVKVIPYNTQEVMTYINSSSDNEETSIAKKIEDLNKDPGNGVLVQEIISDIISNALESRASDLHFHRAEGEYDNWISMRVDGVLRRKFILAETSMASLMARLKLDASMDISESRISQDGRFSQVRNERPIDFRVTTGPTASGEEMVIRVLDPDALKPLDELLEHTPAIYRQVKSLCDFRMKGGGLVLLTGATGSGKSTTLYAMLREMPRLRMKIATAEDPVEYKLAEIFQTPIQEEIGRTFPAVLRHLLRADPDVIVVGEMRDAETAEIAMRAAESGHMLLSTLHTNDVFQGITRLAGMLPADYRSMGLPVIAHYLRMVINQKLARTVCRTCSTTATAATLEDEISVRVCNALGLNPEFEVAVASKEGCERCDHTGYRGRVLVPEVICFPSHRHVGAKIEEALGSVNALRELTKIEGVRYFARKDTALNILNARLVDFQTVFDLLEMGTEDIDNLDVIK